VKGFKAFLVHSGIDEFPAVTEKDLRRVMPLLASGRLPLLVHCELESPVFPDESLPNRSYRKYLASRPPRWEEDAIAVMIKLCGEFNCPVHIVHLSSASSLEQIRRAKEKGMPLTVETAQHYLYFSAEEIPDGETQFKCAPPIRDRENNAKLFAALQEGLIDFVATDHSPAPPALKKIETGDFEKAWGGIASLQFSLPALWTVMMKRGEPAASLAKWLCENPARLPGLSGKGRLHKGLDADIVIFDPAAFFEVKEEMILHRHKITPYLGERLSGLVEHVYLVGEKIYEHGNFLHLNRGEIL
jgi:allantoinase